MAKKAIKKKIVKKATHIEPKHSHKLHAIKEKTKTFFELIRIGNCLMAAIAVLIGFYLAGGFDYRLAALAAVSGFLICGAGQAINDYFDASIDAKTSKERPIPSGRIQAKRALLYSISMFFLGIFASFFINPTTVIIALIFAVLLVAYPLFMNKVKYLGNIVVAGGTAITFIYGSAATGNIPSLIIFLAATAFLANMGREVTKDIEDVKKDLGTKKTLPILLGISPSRFFVLMYYLLAVIGAICVYLLFLFRYPMQYYLVFTILSSLLFAYALVLLYKNNPIESQKISKIAMLASLIGFLLI
ncbi:MAG: geranylgeranylglycerol-phosphate geranylgeranyltransferase [archaeon]